MKYDGIHAQLILALQKPDGSWGQFHSLSTRMRREHGLTTEMALRRLQNLGFTAQDDCIRRAIAYMDACLRGEKSIPDPREKTHDWDAFTEMMLAAWLLRFAPDHALAKAAAQKWVSLLRAAFAQGAYDHAAYCAAFVQAYGHAPRGGRFVDFASFYPLSLTAGLLDAQTEAAVLRYVLHHQAGIYYVYERPISEPPQDFASRQTVRWLEAVELLARHPGAKAQLGFAVDHLLQHQCADGTWDLSPAAKDGIALPLSDSWRRAETRRADCTAYIRRILSKIQ